MAEILGVYDVPEADEPCDLIEMIVPADTDVGAITQVDPAYPPSEGQVP